MCDPLTLAASAMVAGTAVQAVGAMQQGKAARTAGEYNAYIDTQNAERSTQKAKDAMARGEQQLGVLRENQAQAYGSMKAAMGANGVDAGYGSPLDVLIGTSTKMVADQQTMVDNTSREASDYSYQAQSYYRQAALDRAGGQAAQQGAALNAAGTILNGGAKLYTYGSTNGMW